MKVRNKTQRKNLWKKVMDLKISQKELLEMNIIITEIKKSINRLNSRLDTNEERIK